MSNRSGKLDLQCATEIANNLEIQVPIGVLFFHGVPSSEYSLANTPAGNPTWSWLDGDLLALAFENVPPALRVLRQLVSWRFLSAVYRCHSLTGPQGPLLVWKVRVYAIPLDIEGARYLRLWRKQRFKNATLAKRAKAMHLLLHYLDFSEEGWKSLPPRSLILPFLHTESGENLKHHMERWRGQMPLSGAEKTAMSLDDVLLAVYSKIDTPDVSAYRHSGKDAFSPERTILDLLDGEPVPGLKTQLYGFQVESLCKMYEKESFPARDHVSNFMEIASPMGKMFYYDTITGEIFGKPELMTIPRGGILAENMGLGKTLVCLALVCLTKCENSAVPENMLLYREPKAVRRSLFDTAKSTVVENLSWKHYIADIPPHIAETLENTPATFCILEDTEPRARKTKSPVRKLHLCSTTLLIVPENIMHQWIGEIKKHIGDHYLKKLFVSDKHEAAAKIAELLPDVQQLISYDLVLLSSSYFSRLGADNVLMSVYWKRLVIDEGHSLNSRASNLSLLCKSLYAERRWAVSGTPTSGLTNLQMDDTEGPEKKKRKYVVKSKFSAKDDLRKLGNLVTSYFKFEPFSSQPSLWNSTIAKNLADQYSAQHSLGKILNNLMVRHSQSQVENDIRLPSLHHEAVFLAPSYHNKLAINLFTSVLAVNAVTSERVGSDYMFDNSNRKQLRTLVNNLQLSTFYWTGFKLDDVKSLLGVAREYLFKIDVSKSPEKQMSENDKTLLETSIRVAEVALRNPRWRIAAAIHEMQYLVKGLPLLFSKNYAIESLGAHGIYGGPQLIAIQRFFYRNRFGADVALLEDDAKKFWANYWRDFEKKRRAKEKGAKNILADLKTKSFHFPDVASPREAQVLGTALAKLSYLICKLSDNEENGTKSIVFFDFEDHAYFLTESLDILGLKYLLYATFIGSKTRAENLSAFSAHSGGICLIMDLKLASHGLNIISATKVYFINPVWLKSVEAQAIKRAHRIGQTKEVFVETLILKGTLEEEIYRKRTENLDSKHVIDDVGIQSYVLKHEFLASPEIDSCEIEYCPFVTELDLPSVLGASDEFSLPTHTRESANNTTSWTMQLFTAENLEKISETKKRK